MFLTNWLMVTRIVAASVIEAVDYPTPEEFFLAFDGTNTLFMYGGSKDTSSTSNVAIYYDGYKHETGNAYPVVLSEPGEYKALVDVCGTRYLTEAVTVGAVTPPVIPAGPAYTLAFHHGNFDDVYSDGDVATAATNGHVYADTPTGTYSWGTLTANTTTTSNTTYEWTPIVGMTGDVLMVAGGGGGGGSTGGGGGAGGLLFNEGVSLSGSKTIVVGAGGPGQEGGVYPEDPVNGGDTTFSGLDNALGGGGGSGGNYTGAPSDSGVAGNDGGSGGGGGSGSHPLLGGSGTTSQGFAGGSGDGGGRGGGGGGAGGAGDTNNTNGNDGGVGLDYSNIYGTVYGESGWFASGGGGGGYTDGDASIGGGGGGGNSSSVTGQNAQRHTGGGGGGGYGGSSTTYNGGNGGSGIVLLSYQYSTDQLSYNNYNKLTIANTSNANVETNLRLGANTWDIATGSNVWICKPGDYKSFTVDPDGQTAYFGNVTVGTVTEGGTSTATSISVQMTPNSGTVFTGTTCRLNELSVTDSIGQTFVATNTFTTVNGDVFEWMYIGESSSTTAFTAYTLPSSFDSASVTNGTNTEGLGDWWDGVATNTTNTAQYNVDILNGYAEVTGTFSSAIEPNYLVHTTTTSDYLSGSWLKTAKVIYNNTTAADIDLGTTHGIIGAIKDHGYTTTNAVTIAIKLPNTPPQPSLIPIAPGTLAFHHGNFDNVYGDGSVATAATNGHVYADTPTGTYSWGTLTANTTTSSNTTYEWTPIVDMTGDVLMVAGGGAGGSRDAGGGGAGGVLYNTNQSLSGQKTIIIGNSGQGSTSGGKGQNGSDTSITGIDTAIGGGGGGAGSNVGGGDGGSGGGGGGGDGGSDGGGGSVGQGNNGGAGTSGNGWAGGGGGGALTSGQNAPGTEIGGAGGSGKDFTAYFGTNYGDSGYFGGGGGGGGYNTAGAGGNGGGAAGSVWNANASDAQKHTGGGGGGARTSGYYGSSGGSGIVLISDVPFASSMTPSLTYDGYNKLTVAGADDKTLYKDSNSWSLGTASNVYIAESGEYIYFTRDAATAFLANVVVGSVSVDLTLSETSIVKQFIYDENGYTDAYFSEASETQCIRLSSDGLAMALGDGNYNSNDGRLYYYERSSISDTFTKTHTFDAVSSGLEFGASVDMNAAKTRIAISGSDADTNAANAGRVYIYDRASTSASWPSSPTATITPPASTIIRFGHTVNMSDDGLTMITSGDGTDSTANKGGVYVYEYASGSWSKTFQVTQNILRFGYKVAMNKEGTRFIAGGTGTAYYVYHKVSGTWSSTVQLTGATGYNCGMSPDGNTVAVGIVQYSSNLGRVAVYKYSGGSWGSATNIDTTVGSGIYSFGNTPVFNNDGTLLVTGCSGYNSYMGCFEMWKYESGSWVFKKQFLNPTVNTGEFFGSYLSMDYAGTSLIVSDTGNDVAGENYGRVVLYGAGSLPSLTYDGLNSLKVTGAETSSYITYKAYESNKFLACGTDLTTYPLSKTGNYKAEIAGSSTFTLTSNVLVPATNIVPLYQYPPTDGTTSGVTETVTADVNSIWTVSGAGYGNGLYHAQASVAATSTSVTAYHAFDNNLTAGFETTSSTIGTLRVQLPSTETVHKYVVWPKAADGNRPKSWVIEGSQDAATWTTIHTVTDSPPSLSGDIHEIYSPAAYVYYRINVLANNGGTGLEIAELVLWGDVAFSITFSDGWVTTNGSNTIPIGTSYTLPTYTSSLPVKVTGASDLDVNTAGTYKVVYTSIGIDELARRVVRQFVVEYPAIAFHYAGFVATDYNSTYATKEAAAADGFVYADTPDGTYSWGTLTVTSNTTSNTQYTWTPVTAITADVLMVAGGGGGGGHRGGGGGAGGLLFNGGVTLSGSKTIVIGNGGYGGYGWDNYGSMHGLRGANTYISGMTTAVGGGGGGTHLGTTSKGEPDGNRDGGSGGGGAHDNVSGDDHIPGSGIQGQGFDGGTGYDNIQISGGGGGAGGGGQSASSSKAGDGGTGKYYGYVYDDVYGDSGYFSSGGGGGTDTYIAGSASIGGGGAGVKDGQNSSKGYHAQKHTGGGGGGGAYSVGSSDRMGGSGGSGIVLVKRTA
jgi:hypothetical protein